MESLNVKPHCLKFTFPLIKIWEISSFIQIFSSISVKDNCGSLWIFIYFSFIFDLALWNIIIRHIRAYPMKTTLQKQHLWACFCIDRILIIPRIQRIYSNWVNHTQRETFHPLLQHLTISLYDQYQLQPPDIYTYLWLFPGDTWLSTFPLIQLLNIRCASLISNNSFRYTFYNRCFNSNLLKMMVGIDSRYWTYYTIRYRFLMFILPSLTYHMYIDSLLTSID